MSAEYRDYLLLDGPLANILRPGKFGEPPINLYVSVAKTVPIMPMAGMTPAAPVPIIKATYRYVFQGTRRHHEYVFDHEMYQIILMNTESCPFCGQPPQSQPDHAAMSVWLARAEADCATLREALQAQGEEAAEALRDAERYRWLREQVRTGAGVTAVQAMFWNCGESRRQLDGAIDKARVEND